MSMYLLQLRVKAAVIQRKVLLVTGVSSTGNREPNPVLTGDKVGDTYNVKLLGYYN